jgi:hypothetical protein
MSILKSVSDHLTLNAEGTSKSIKFQSAGVEKASISPAGAFTSTTIDATVLTGALPAISGASLTGLDATVLTGALPAISGANLTGLVALSADNSWTGKQTLKEITETEATSSAATYTVDLANGTIFEVTHATLCTVTMPTAAAGKSFTVISTVPAAWSGTILWSGGAAPTTGSAKTIYSFVSNGSSWYGMQAGTGFA